MADQEIPMEIVWELADGAKDVVLCLDQSGKIVYANRSAEEKLGYDHHEFLGRTVWDFSLGFPPSLNYWKNDSRIGHDNPSFYTYFNRGKKSAPAPYEISLKHLPYRDKDYHLIFAREINSKGRAFESVWENDEDDEPFLQGKDFGMVISDPDGRLLEVCDNFHRMLGYKKEELIDKNFKDITHPDDLDSYRESTTRMLSGRLPVFWQEKRYIRKDGRDVWAVLSTSIHHDRLGEPVCLVSHIQDVTERKIREEALDETRQLFQNTFEDAAVGMIIFDASGFIIRVNSNICRLLGYNDQELIGKHFAEITHPDDVELSVDSDRRLLNREIPFVSYEKRYLHKNGAGVWVLISNSLLHDRNNRPRYFVAHCQNLSQLRKAEKNLVQSERRFQLFMDHLPGKAFIKKGRGPYLYGNAFFKKYGEDKLARNLIGLSDQDIYSPESADEMNKNDTEVMDAGQAREFVERTGEGEDEKFWLTLKFPIEQQGESVLLGGIALDITQRIRAGEALEERDRELELQKENLERVNNALKVVMEHRQTEMLNKERDTLATLEKLVLPYLHILKTRGLDPEKASYLDIALENLTNVAEEFARRLSTEETLLSPAELKVADLLRHGRTTDEISEMLCISPYTVARHRAGIRKKLELTNKKVNLRTYLKSLPSK